MTVIDAVNRRHVREPVQVHVEHVDVVAVRLGHGVVHRVLANLTGSLQGVNTVLTKEVNVKRIRLVHRQATERRKPLVALLESARRRHGLLAGPEELGVVLGHHRGVDAHLGRPHVGGGLHPLPLQAIP